MQVIDELGIDPEKLTVDRIDVQGDANMFHRFDRFNNKYNPIGKQEGSQARRIIAS